MTVPEYARWYRRDKLITRGLMALCVVSCFAILAAMLLWFLPNAEASQWSRRDTDIRAALAMRAKFGPQSAEWEFGFLPRPPAEDLGWVPPDTTEEVGGDGVTEWTFASYGMVPVVDEEGNILGWWWVEPGDRIRREAKHMVHIRWV